MWAVPCLCYVYGWRTPGRPPALTTSQHCGSFRKFDFDAKMATAMDEKQIQLRSRIGCPKVSLIGAKEFMHLLDNEALPRRPDHWMSQQRLFIGQDEQGVQQSTIFDVNFGRSDLSFLDVDIPRLKLPHHHHTCQQVQVHANGFIG